MIYLFVTVLTLLPSIVHGCIKVPQPWYLDVYEIVTGVLIMGGVPWLVLTGLFYVSFKLIPATKSKHVRWRLKTSASISAVVAILFLIFAFVITGTYGC